MRAQSPIWVPERTQTDASPASRRPPKPLRRQLPGIAVAGRGRRSLRPANEAVGLGAKQTPAVVSLPRLREQVAERGLDHSAVVVGLGGRAYQSVVEAAFAGTASTVVFPFAGLPIGTAMQAVNRAVASGEPGFVPPEGIA